MMDIDPPSLCSNLKRSNSAPMINELGTNASSGSQDNLRARGGSCTPVSQKTARVTQTRRFSGSFSPSRSSHSPTAPLSPLVLTRVSQIKQEESMDVVFREAAHERETKSKLQISHSLEDLTLDEASFGENNKRSLTDPLRIHTSHIVMSCSSPSPTNTGRQCFSPSTCLPVHQSSAFSSTPSPSPTRKNFTRCSQSPISLRPSQLSLKRKFDMDSDDSDYMPSNAKHLNTGGMSSPERSNPPHHIQNLSFNSMDTCNSDQNETRRSSDSLSSCLSSPYGTFKPVDPAPSNPKSYN